LRAAKVIDSSVEAVPAELLLLLLLLLLDATIVLSFSANKRRSFFSSSDSFDFMVGIGL
jgi:hypothetical protein